ncbi:MAG: hypothetical protein HY721_02135 [Planctomycetes bacterium]|nr:hypothetical protein [Planctomycetota bacterium]
MCRSSAVSVDRLAGWTLVGLAIVVGSWGRGLAYVGTVEVVPPRPTADDPVVVRVSGDLPDTCWSFVGHEVAASGGRITIRVQTSVRTGICLFVLIPYGFEAALGRLQPGPYQLTVIDAQDSKTVSFEVSGEVPV